MYYTEKRMISPNQWACPLKWCEDKMLADESLIMPKISPESLTLTPIEDERENVTLAKTSKNKDEKPGEMTGVNKDEQETGNGEKEGEKKDEKGDETGETKREFKIALEATQSGKYLPRIKDSKKIFIDTKILNNSMTKINTKPSCIENTGNLMSDVTVLGRLEKQESYLGELLSTLNGFCLASTSVMKQMSVEAIENRKERAELRAEL